MPGSVHSIIVGGGLGVIAPSTVGNIPKFDGATPPDVLDDSILRQVAGPPQSIIVGTTDPAPTATETLRTTGGIISRGAGSLSTVMGDGAATGAGETGAISIGDDAIQGAAGNTTMFSSIVIGRSSTLNNGTGGGAAYTGEAESSILIGAANTADASGSSQPNRRTLIVGSGNTVSSTIGSTAENNIVVGYGNNPGDACNGVIWIGNFGVGSSQLGQAIVVGTGVNHPTTSVQNICIGNSQNWNAGSGSNSIGIGRSVSMNNPSANAIGIGFNAQVGADFAIAIGSTATAFGTGCIAIGRSAQANQPDSMAMGTGAATVAQYQVVFGSGNSGADFREFVFGNRGPSAASGLQPVVWRNSDAASGSSDLAAQDLTIRAGVSTGAATPAKLHFQSAVAIASGGTQQTPLTVLTLDAGTPGSSETGMLLYDTDAGTLQRVTIGAADSGGTGFRVLRVPN